MAEKVFYYEKTVILPQENRKSFSEKLPLATPISPELAAASLDVASSVGAGKEVGRLQVQALTDATIQEFTKNASPISPEQRKEFQADVAKVLKNEKLKPSSKEDVSKINLKDYLDTFNYVYKLYGLDKHAVKLDFLEGIMMTKAAIMKLVPPMMNKAFSTIMFNDKSAQLLGMFGDFKKMTHDRKATFLKVAGKVTFPIWGPLAGMLSATVLDGAARKSYEKETMFMRKAINDRVANSVFMRDFEFVQDKSPAEILNIIDKGKQGTMDLLNITFTDVIPNLTSAVAATGTGFGISKVGGVLGLLRLPVLYGSSKKQMEQMISDRQLELRQKDAVDTRIMTSLQSIEVVKASDTMENAIKELGTTMQERDELTIESRKRRVKQNQTGSYLDMLFQFGLPGALGGLEYRKLKGKGASDLEAGLRAFNQFTVIASGQAEAGTHSTELIRLYSEKIQPALQDVKRMEELLGPYELLDKPDGPLEKLRKPVNELTNFDIRVKDLNFKNILHNVSMDIPQGSFVTVKGPSGIGKTTFLRHLVGFYGAQTESLQYGGVDLDKIKKFGDESIYTKLAYANQNPQYFENMTLRENLLLWTKKQVDDDKLNHVLRDLKLDHILDRMDSKVKHFSGGELRRIGIARALLKDPKVLFLDEPTANLDQESAKQVLEIIKDMRVKRPDMTVVAVTHDENFEKIAEKIVDFREINKPKVGDMTLGDRQVFYADAKGK